ncbi:NAD(P)-binding protein [Mycena latifolia]|nr:NAD(P)-binding protein [Mycena latifolia]
MPAISSGRVLVTGANGFIGAWIIRSLLEGGLAVRGTVRTASKCGHLRDMFASAGDRFEVVVVPDMTQEGAFDEAVKAVDAIVHTASPMNLKEPDEFIAPAVKGTVGLLQSTLKDGASVQRVVVTSSAAAVMQVEDEPRMFDERDWNEQSPKEVAELGSAAPSISKYRAAKTLAERAAWDFVADHKSEIGWDLATVIPPFVFGPHINEAITPDALTSSSRRFYAAFTQPSTPEVLRSGAFWLDVRDLGRAHVLALLEAAAGGERIIVSAGPFFWQDCLDAAPDSSKYQKGDPGATKDAVQPIRYDASKAARVLGMTGTAYRALEETVRDTVADWEARGW